jgi:dTDP-4-amino-4,6-dideoxygalactose transaminase
MKKTKEFLWPSFTPEEINIVSNVLKSNNVNYLFGKKGKTFEHNFCKMTGTKYSLALANGTLALDIALRSLQVQKGDEILVTCRSFVATASSISLLGAIPVWCDVDINTQNISLEEIKKKFTTKTKAIVCVHFAGYPCEMHEIMKFAKSKKIKVIEDCAQAHGAKINNQSVGSFGDIAAWSFCNDKIMSLGGEGGMISTNNLKLFRFCKNFNNHGKNFKKISALNKNVSKFPYIHDSIGSNYRLTEMQSALGIYQLKKLKNWQRARARNAEIFINAIKDLNIVSYPMLPKKFTHAWYKLYLTLNRKHMKKNFSRKKILNALNHSGVSCGFGGSGEIYKEKAFLSINQGAEKRQENGYFLERNSIMLLIHPTISKEEILRRASSLRSIFLEAQV